jgi:predicted transcriptional regulator
MKVLLSIKPDFAERIFDGSKKYEFRKAIFKNPQVKTVVVYASSPVQRVIGEFDIETILIDEPATLWEETKEYSGITEEFFFEYFNERRIGYAIKIKETRRYKKSRCLRTRYNKTPPQSFCYV